MVVTFEPPFASIHTSRALFLPLVVKHRIADLLESLTLSHVRIVGQVDWLFRVLHDRAPFRNFFLRRLESSFFSGR